MVDADTIGRLRLSDSNFVEFGTSGGPRDIVAGPDGNLWFTKAASDAIGRITPAGTQVAGFTAGISPGAVPNSIALGPDGNIWFTQFNDDRVGRITPGGTITLYTPRVTRLKVLRGRPG